MSECVFVYVARAEWEPCVILRIETSWWDHYFFISFRPQGPLKESVSILPLTLVLSMWWSGFRLLVCSRQLFLLLVSLCSIYQFFFCLHLYDWISSTLQSVAINETEDYLSNKAVWRNASFLQVLFVLFFYVNLFTLFTYLLCEFNYLFCLGIAGGDCGPLGLYCRGRHLVAELSLL